MEVEADASMVAGDLATALEQAALMAKQLPTATDQSQIFQIHTALQVAHHHLSQFLSQFPPPPNHPQREFLPTPQPENSISSAVGGEKNGETGGGEPMQMGDYDEDGQNSRAAAVTVEKVEEKTRECFIQNKRLKRRLSPTAEPRRAYDDVVAAEFDPHEHKLRSLELIYQFHA